MKRHRPVFVATLIAIEAVLSRFLSIATPIVKIGFGFVPVAMCGMMYGPIWAGVPGAVADIIGAILFRLERTSRVLPSIALGSAFA